MMAELWRLPPRCRLIVQHTEGEMAKTVIHTEDAPKSFAGYSQAIKSNGLVFVSGRGPFDTKTGEVVGTTIL
jgi:enamine deaminase RidA (YjgF/YER057c/UK114 family)